MIKKYEGWRDTAYICPAGKLTIGWGRTENVNIGDKTTQEQEEIWLEKYLAKLRNKILELIEPVILTQDQIYALMSFVYNLGIGNFSTSTLLRKIKSHNLEGASQEFERWVYVNGEKNSWIEKRRKEERELFCGKRK